MGASPVERTLRIVNATRILVVTRGQLDKRAKRRIWIQLESGGHQVDFQVQTHLGVLQLVSTYAWVPSSLC